MKFEYWQCFVLGTILAWGMYVPTIHSGQIAIGGNPKDGAIRAFLCVGLAYFVTAVLVPLVLLFMGLAGNEKFEFAGPNGLFNWRGIGIATLAGVFGAAGALGIIMSIKVGGRPLIIAPLVFAGAPIVNTLITCYWHPPKHGTPSTWLMFGVGIVLAALGAGLVLFSSGRMKELEKKAMKQQQEAVKLAQQSEPSSQPSTGITTES